MPLKYDLVDCPHMYENFAGTMHNALAVFQLMSHLIVRGSCVTIHVHFEQISIKCDNDMDSPMINTKKVLPGSYHTMTLKVFFANISTYEVVVIVKFFATNRYDIGYCDVLYFV